MPLKRTDAKPVQGDVVRASHVHASPQVDIPVCIFVFDALFVDGEVLTGLPLRARRARLAQVLYSCTPQHELCLRA